MDMIALGWRGAISGATIEQTIIEAGLSYTDLSGDSEVTPGLHECMQALSFDDIRYLVDSKNDTTSNNLSLKLAAEVRNGEELALSRLGRQVLEQIKDGEVWLLFAHDWPKGVEVTYHEGTPSDLSSYMKLNGGPYRMIYSFRANSRNIDLDTPLVWKLIY